jgi:hypothetical protein
MSDNNKYDIADIINFSSEQKPVEVKSVVDAIMLQKAHAAIEAKKIETAKKMFGDAAGPEDPDYSEEDWEEDQEDMTDDSDTSEDDDDLDLDISDEELEELLNDLEDLDDTDFDDNLEDDNSEVEDTEDGENA